MRKWLVLALLPLAACSGGSSSHTVTGTMTITDSTSVFSTGDSCTGTDGYDDISSGAQVRIRNEKDALIGTSELHGDGVDIDGKCMWAFKVPDVPAAKFYTIEVSHRGGITYSSKQMDRQKWAVGLTIG